MIHPMEKQKSIDSGEMLVMDEAGINKKFVKHEYTCQNIALVQQHENFISGALKSFMNDMKSWAKDLRDQDKRLSLLDNKINGRVSIMWNVGKFFIGGIFLGILTLMGGMALFWLTQNGHLNRTEVSINKMQKSQYAQILLMQYAETKNPAIKLEADRLLRELKP